MNRKEEKCAPSNDYRMWSLKNDMHSQRHDFHHIKSLLNWSLMTELSKANIKLELSKLGSSLRRFQERLDQWKCAASHGWLRRPETTSMIVLCFYVEPSRGYNGLLSAQLKPTHSVGQIFKNAPFLTSLCPLGMMFTKPQHENIVF